MGGFLLVLKQRSESLASIKEVYADSINTISKRGVSLNFIIDHKDCVAFIFAKANFRPDNAIQFNHGDFIFATGSLFYKGKIGSEALTNLYDDFKVDGTIFDHLRGHYFVCLYKESNLYCFNDYSGIYCVYTNTDKTILCSSFLGLSRSQKRRTISEQELFEYISNGAWYGDATIIKEVMRLDSHNIHRLTSLYGTFTKIIAAPNLNPDLRLEEQRDFVAHQLIDYFQGIKKTLDSSVCSGLTGGFDTRLVVGLCRKVGINPRLYVYGKEDSQDVKLAKLICQGEHLAIECQNKSRFPRVTVEEFVGAVQAQYYFLDAQFEAGSFDPGTDLWTRRWRTAGTKLQLNAVGGEIYRNYFYVPERRVDIYPFIRQHFDVPNLRWFTSRFSQESYFQTLVAKLKLALGTTSDQLSRQQAEMAYLAMRLRYWNGPNTSANNVLSYSLAPFSEPIFILTCLQIPIRYKYAGKFEAAVISAISPEMAKYPSIYGYNFLSAPPAWAMVKEWLKTHTPVFLRPTILKPMRRLVRKKPYPYFLQKEYVDEVLGSGAKQVSDYIHFDRIRHPQVLNRALTMELLIRDLF